VAVSPEEGEGAGAMSIGIAAIVWLFVVQIVSYGVAGYVTGRLRPIWAPGYSDEVYVRDTAHGLAVWALSALVSVALFGSAMSTVLGTAVKGGAAVLQGTATVAATGAGAAGAAAGEGGLGGVSGMPSSDYFVDRMFRCEQPSPTADPADARAEVAIMLTVAAMRGDLAEQDRAYISRVIAAQSGVTEAEARERVDQVMTQAEQMRQEVTDQAQEVADAARKAAAAFALWAFAALLVGAFVASWMAMVGGRAARSPH